MNKNNNLHNIRFALSTYVAVFTLTVINPPRVHAQDNKASPRERAGAVVFGEHCSACHGVRMLKEDAAYDLANPVKNMTEERFIQGAKTRRGAMPSFASLLKDAELADVYAYVKRGHTPDLDDVRMESNH
jgi:mono/diheme cytochrome c family protein